MRRALLLLLMVSAVSLGQNPVLPGPLNRTDDAKIARRIWYASLGAVAVSNVLDIESSWGKRETNRLLAGPGGAFTARSVGVKVGVQVPLLAFEFWRVKRGFSRAGFLTTAAANFAMSAFFTGTAIHNYAVPGPH